MKAVLAVALLSMAPWSTSTQLDGICQPEHDQCEVEDVVNTLVHEVEDLKTKLALLKPFVKLVNERFAEYDRQFSNQSAHLTTLDGQTAEHDTRLVEQASQISQLDELTASMVHESELSSLPLGSIVSWVPMPARGDAGIDAADVPEKWQICDGSEIQTGPWAGKSTPDMTDFFLRGGAPSDFLTEEQDMLQDHKHKDPGHTHSDSKGHSHQYWDSSITGSGRIDDAKRYSYSSVRRTTDKSYVTLNKAYTGVEYVQGSSAKVGHETRPKNKRVVFIMRIA